MIKAMLFAFSFLFVLNTWASADWRSSAVLAAAVPALQQQVDEVTEELFQSNLKEALCSVYNNPYSASHALGISDSAASRIFAKCPQSSFISNAKVLDKRYYLSFASPQGLDSWTDFGNRTYIFVDEFLDRKKLKSIILHEIAISTDAKTNMMYTGYLVYRNKEHSKSVNGTLIISIDNLSEQERSLQEAFNWSTWKPVRLAFTTLRAFNLEKYMERQPLSSTHDNCVNDFKKMLATMKALPPEPKAQGLDEIAESIADFTSRARTPRTPEQEAQVLDFLMSPHLQLRDPEDNPVSFCQFMTRPLITGKSLYSFYGSGPRPRLTGGSGGQGGDKKEVTKVDPSITPRPTVNFELKESVDTPDDFQKAIEELKKKWTPSRD